MNVVAATRGRHNDASADEGVFGFNSSMAVDGIDDADEEDGRTEVTYVADGQGRMIPAETNQCARARKAFCFCCNDTCLDIIVGAVICFNTVLLAVELDHDWAILNYMEHFCLCVYIIDVFFRLRWHGLKLYLANGSHCIDLFLVSSSVLEMWIIPPLLGVCHGMGDDGMWGDVVISLTMTLRGLRLIRSFRLLSFVKFTMPIYRILHSMMLAFRRVSWVIMLIAMFLYSYSLVFTQLLGRNSLGGVNMDDAGMAKIAARFYTLNDTLFELFRVLCGDVTDFGILISESDSIYILVAYMCFQISTCWLALAIFTAQVVDSTITNSAEEIKKEVAEKAMHARTQKQTQVTEGLATFLEAASTDGKVDFGVLADFLEVKENSEKLQKLAGVSPYQAVSVWDAIQIDGQVDLDDMVEGLQMAAHHDVDHSLLRIEAQLRRLQKIEQGAGIDIPETAAPDPKPPMSPKAPSSPKAGSQPGAPMPHAPFAGAEHHDHSTTISHSMPVRILENVMDLRGELAQVSLDIQNMYAQMASPQKEDSSKDVEQAMPEKSMNLQQELAELRTEIRGTKTVFAEVREQIRQLPTNGELRGEMNAEEPKLQNNVGLRAELRGELDLLRRDFAAATDAHTERLVATQTKHIAALQIEQSASIEVRRELETLRKDLLSSSDSQRVELTALRGDIATMGRNKSSELHQTTATSTDAAVKDMRKQVEALCGEFSNLADAQKRELAGLSKVEVLRKDFANLADVQRHELSGMRNDLVASVTMQNQSLEALRAAQVEKFAAGVSNGPAESMQEELVAIRSEISSLAQSIQSERTGGSSITSSPHRTRPSVVGPLPTLVQTESPTLTMLQQAQRRSSLSVPVPASRTPSATVGQDESSSSYTRLQQPEQSSQTSSITAGRDEPSPLTRLLQAQRSSINMSSETAGQPEPSMGLQQGARRASVPVSMSRPDDANSLLTRLRRSSLIATNDESKRSPLLRTDDAGESLAGQKQG